MDDEARLTHYRDFLNDRVRVLLVTDVAARSLDIPSLDVDFCDVKTFCFE